MTLADKRDLRNPTYIGNLILLRKEKHKVPAHVQADQVLNTSKNGSQRDP